MPAEGHDDMHPIETRQYRAKEFARITRVTVRTLQYYDRLGLLRPRRTQAGYRLYGAADQEALRLIRVLKFVGFPLKKIRMMIRGKPTQLADALRAQHAMLRTKQVVLDQAIGALTELERALENRQPIDDALLRSIVETIEPQSRSDRQKQYQHQLTAKVERLKDNLGRAGQFADLYRDIEGALNIDPSSTRAQELAARWVALGADPDPVAFDPRLVQAARQMFREAFATADGLQPAISRFANSKIPEFIERALAVRRGQVDPSGGE